LLGGNWSAFNAAGCEASAAAVPDIYHQPGGKRIRIGVPQQGTRPCGLWTHLFNENASARARGCRAVGPYLIFWVNGTQAGEDFSIATAHRELFEGDDTRVAGTIGKYLIDGVSTEWERVVVPLSDFRLECVPVSLAVLLEKIGREAIFIDDIELSEMPGFREPRRSGRTVVASPRAKALWVWNTRELLEAAASRRKFFSFARDNGFDQIFLQILYTVGNDRQGRPTITIDDLTGFRDFLAEASTAGIKVHALDGYPEFVLGANHPRVLALVRAILDFNRAAPPGQRFYGIHLDNEAYLLLGFDGPARDSIVRQFMELNQQVMELLRNSRRPVVYGIDIPLRFADIMATVENSGVTSASGAESLTDRILDVVDNVCIMDYRTEAGSPNGIIEHARSTVHHANSVGKQVFIGVETFRNQPSPIHFLYGVTEAEWDTLARGNAPLMRSSSLDGFPLRTFDDGRRHHVGVAPPRGSPHGRLNDVLNKIYSIYGATAHGRQADLRIVTAQAREALARFREYRGFQPFDLNKDGAAAGFITSEQMLASTTFDGHTRSQMGEVLNQVIDYFRNDPGFYGIAIDDYDHYRALRP